MEENRQNAARESDKCIAIGAGVGAIGLAVGAIVDATCPLCFVIAPSLIGAGLVHRIRERMRRKGRITKESYLKIREKRYVKRAQ